MRNVFIFCLMKSHFYLRQLNNNTHYFTNVHTHHHKYAIIHLSFLSKENYVFPSIILHFSSSFASFLPVSSWSQNTPFYSSHRFCMHSRPSKTDCDHLHTLGHRVRNIAQFCLLCLLCSICPSRTSGL